MTEPSLPTNRMAIVSLFSAVLTLLSFCVGFAPFLPLTAPVCYPLALVFGAVALGSGMLALLQLRTRAQNGRWMALAGTFLGGVTTFATVCAATLTISALATWLAELVKQSSP